MMNFKKYLSKLSLTILDVHKTEDGSRLVAMVMGTPNREDFQSVNQYTPFYEVEVSSSEFYYK
jgi:hypothetical protein